MTDDRNPRMSSVLGESAVVIGNVTGIGDFEVRGRVQGSIRLSGRVFVAESGAVLGGIEAISITVAGEVRGDLSAEDGVLVQASGRVEGNMEAPRVGIEAGARVRGVLRTGTELGKTELGKESEEPRTSPGVDVNRSPSGSGNRRRRGGKRFNDGRPDVVRSEPPEPQAKRDVPRDSSSEPRAQDQRPREPQRSQEAQRSSEQPRPREPQRSQEAQRPQEAQRSQEAQRPSDARRAPGPQQPSQRQHTLERPSRTTPEAVREDKRAQPAPAHPPAPQRSEAAPTASTESAASPKKHSHKLRRKKGAPPALLTFKKGAKGHQRG